MAGLLFSSYKMEYEDDDEAVLHHTSDDEDEEADQQPLWQRRQRIFCKRINFEIIDFRARFRCTVYQVSDLVNTIGQFLQHDTYRNHALTPRQQVLIALRFFADGAGLRIIGDAHGVSKATVSRCIHRTTNAIIDHLFVEAVDFPVDNVYLLNIPRQFQQTTHSQMPSVCGCIDGTHVNIIAPHVNEEQFINRHDVHS